MAGPAEDRGGEFAAIKRKLKSLDGRVDQAAAKHAPPSDRNGRGSAMGAAFRISAELIAGVLVGGAIGWLLDAWLGTTPAFLLVFFFLGAGAGILNVIRTAKAMQVGSGAGTGKSVPNDDDD